ncbi:MAG: BamA/TamA family outer membrane protein [Flavobacteriales bacterium]|nr:BamA/TamA family outer membrane protein [Flavobacteriales bacterium]
MRSRTDHIPWALAVALLLVGCDAAKHVPEGRQLLAGNTVRIDREAGRTIPRKDPIDLEEVGAIVKQKPNKRVLGLPFYLALYNLRDPDRVVRRRAEHDSLCLVNNRERELKGRRPKTCDRSTRGRNGEPPVVLDTALVRRSTEQIRMYLQKEGYFHAQVKDSIEVKGRKARVTYTLLPGPAYTFCDVQWSVDEGNMDAYMREAWERSHLKVGGRFDADALEAERERVALLMRENGFLLFNRDLVMYDADTGMGGHTVDLRMRIERPLGRNQRGLKGTREGTIFHVERVIIDEDTRSRGRLSEDTTHLAGYDLIHRGELPPYRPEALLCGMYLRPDQRFKQSDADLTYRRLTNLRVFDRVDIRYDTTGTSRPDGVNCIVQLTPGKVQNLSLEGFITNRGGFMGTSLSVGYRHRNLFRSMASITASMNFGFEAQQSVTGNNAGGDAGTTVGRDGLFNTIEFGPEVTLRFPNFLLPVKCGTFARSAAPRTTIAMLYNYQRRPDYTRSLAKFSFGYEWNESRTKTWGVFPIDLNVIRLPYYSPEFLEFLQTTNDPVLTDSYTDHLIAGARVVYTLNTQDASVKRRNYFLRSTLQTSGNLLNAYNRITDRPMETDSTGASYYTAGNVRFAQFVKLDNDLRYYYRIHEKSSLAMRVMAGIGVPFGNLTVLPFETSFYGGGANGIRAWQVRSLGPGSYSAPRSFDRIGDMHLEGNLEYRVKLIGYLEGALFVDAGNIWSLRPNPAKPGGEFEVDDFVSEIAVGGGLGARLNFDYFLVRFDLGVQMKDPGRAVGERWYFQRSDKDAIGRVMNLNLGIGYPF